VPCHRPADWFYRDRMRRPCATLRREHAVVVHAGLQVNVRLVRFARRCALAGLLVVAITAGCSGPSTPQTLSAVDLQRITAIQPVMPGWDWPLEPMPRAEGPTSETPTISDTPTGAPDPLEAALERGIADAGGIVAADGSRWQDAEKLGVTFAWLLKDAAGAHIALAAGRAFEHGWAERDGGTLTDLPIDGLGDEAWAIGGTDSPVGQTSTYGWRRNSLVLMVHVQCIFRACPSEISFATRGWVDAIDRAAATAIANQAASSP